MLVRHAQVWYEKLRFFFIEFSRIFFVLLYFQTDIIATDQLNCCRLILLLSSCFLSFDLTEVIFFAWSEIEGKNRTFHFRSCISRMKETCTGEWERANRSRCHLRNEFSASFHSHFILSAHLYRCYANTATATANTTLRIEECVFYDNITSLFICLYCELPLMHLFNGCALNARHRSCSIPKKTNRITNIEWSCHSTRCTKETHISYWKEAGTIACVEL